MTDNSPRLGGKPSEITGDEPMLGGGKKLLRVLFVRMDAETRQPVREVRIITADVFWRMEKDNLSKKMGRAFGLSHSQLNPTSKPE